MQLGGRALYVLDSLPYPLHEGYTAVQRMPAGRLIYSARRVPSGQEVVVKFCLQYGATVGVGGWVGVYGRWQRVFAVNYLKTGGSYAGKPRTCTHEGMLWAGLCRVAQVHTQWAAADLAPRLIASTRLPGVRPQEWHTCPQLRDIRLWGLV